MNFPISAGRFAIVWLAMAVAMSVNGVTRELLFKHFFRDSVAEAMSVVIGMIIIGLITLWGFRPMSGASPSVAQLAMVSVALVILTVVFEAVVGRYVDHKTWPQLLEHYAIWRGDPWPIVLAWLAYTPFAWGQG